MTHEAERLDLMLRCELGDETASPGYAAALAAYNGDPDDFTPPWFFDGDWHHCCPPVDISRFIDADCSVYWSTFNIANPFRKPTGPKFKTALEAMEAEAPHA